MIENFKNWKDKSKNIIEISKELDLWKAFVWDDNPIERKIKNNLKEVEVIEPSPNVSDWDTQLLELTTLTKFDVTKEDKIRLNNIAKELNLYLINKCQKMS